LVIARRPGAGDGFDPLPFPQQGFLAAMFFVTATIVVGLPPWSGFLGKLQILASLQATSEADWPFLWGAILGSSLLVLVGFAQAGSRIFWKSVTSELRSTGQVSNPECLPVVNHDLPLVMPIVAIAVSWGLLLLLTAFPSSVMSYIDATAEQLFDPQLYIKSVLKQSEGMGQ
jgi:multicomponent K+:H+ antiporter subunit D